MAPKADMLFESSWEVCNKVGGIYTVVKSKAALMTDLYKNYFLIGPLYPGKARIEAQQSVPPAWLKSIFDELEKEGLSFYFGKWRIKGEPNVILVDFYKWAQRSTEMKKFLWEKFRVETHLARWDYDEPMIWSYAVGRLIELISQRNQGKKIVAHFHEWLAGISILYLKHNAPLVKTVFTTHATMLGRAIAGSGQDLYKMLPQVSPREKAIEIGVLDKYSTEKACATACDVFTTVSETTALEAEKILGRKADVLLLNGLDIDKFPTFEESSVMHTQLRDKVREFCSSFFFPFYSFDMDQSLFYYIVGRYEFKNKGIDIMIEALSQLNNKLKEDGSKKTIVAFFWIPAGVGGIKMPVLENQEQFEQINSYVEGMLPALRSRIISKIMKGEELSSMSLLEPEEIHEIAAFRAKFSKDNGPYMCTHQLSDEASDPILNAFRNAGLLNREEDKVKVIFYPVYLDGSDRLLEMRYYKALQACHLGIFPSYYEPWGYTPLESAALGVPSITTDLAGFGRFINKYRKGPQNGIFVIDRLGKQDSESTKQLFSVMYDYSKLDRKARVEQKMAAKKVAELADWKELINNYVQAHDMAAGKDA